MIQHHHRLTAFQQFRTFRNAGLAHIHYYQYRIVPHHLQRLRIVHDHIFFIAVAVPKHIDHRLHRRPDIIQHNMGRLIQCPGNPVDSYRGAKAVGIPHPVSHNIYFIFNRYDLLKCVCLHSGLNTGALLHLLALTAIIGNILRYLHHRLVTAASQRNINRITGKLIILRIAESVKSHTDADRHSHLITDIDRLDIFQQIKAAFLQLHGCLLAHDHKILVLLQLPADSVKCSNILIHLTIDQGDQQGAPHFFHALQRFIIIIQIDQTYGQRLVVHFTKRDLQRCLIKHVKGNQVTVIPLCFYDITVLRHLAQ